MNDTGISMRPAEQSDIGPIKEIFFRAMQDYGIALPADYPVSDIETIGLPKTDRRTEVLFKDDCLVGFIMLQKIAGDRLEVKRLYLDAAHRGRGLGRYLLQFAIAYAQSEACRWVQLETTSRFTSAVAFYRKHGFSSRSDINTAPGHDLAFEKDLSADRDHCR